MMPRVRSQQTQYQHDRQASAGDMLPIEPKKPLCAHVKAWRLKGFSLFCRK
jgi:hypothetical protein